MRPPLSLPCPLPEFLTEAEDGDIVLAGHRIGLHHLVERYNEGFSPEMLVCQYPSLPLSLVHRVLAFYLDQRVEVDRYLAAYLQDLHQQEATANRINLTELRARLQQISAPVATAH